MIRTILKKDITELLSFTKKEKKTDILGIILSVFILATCLGFGIFIYQKLIGVYLNIKIDNVVDLTARKYELLTITYFVIIIVGALGCQSELGKALFEKEDLKIYTSLPVKNKDVFIAKMIMIYFKQLLITTAVVLPINITFSIMTELTLSYIFSSLLLCIFIPIVNLSIAGVICLPIYYLKRIISNKYLVLLLVSTAVISLLFWGYSSVLSFFNKMLTTGEISFFFNEKTMNVIMSTVKWLYPANTLAGMLLGINAYKNFGIFIGIVVLCFAIGMGTIILLFNKAIQLRYNPKDFGLKIKPSGKLNNTFTALLKKDFLTVYKTPSYATLYFSMALIMPIMTYFCMKLGQLLITNLIYLNCNFELGLGLTVLFGVLTNSFCATNVSREGKTFFLLRTMPVSLKTFMLEKVSFSMIVATISILVNCILLLVLGYVNVYQTLFIFVVASIIAYAQICFATRLDFNRPVFSKEDDGLVKESNGNVSRVIVYGLLNAFVIGGSMITTAFWYGIREVANYKPYLYMGISALAIIEAGCASFYLFFNLENSFEKAVGGIA